jgi:hypothetical protein
MSSNNNSDDTLPMAYSAPSSVDSRHSTNSLKENMNQAAKERRKQRRRLRQQEFDKTDKSDDQSVNSSSRMPEKPRRRNSKPKYSGTGSSGSSSKKSGSIIWTMLVIGLVFCMADICYIIYFVDRYPDLLAKTVSRLSPSKPLTPLRTHPPNLSHEKEMAITSNDWQDKQPILNLLKDAGVPLDPVKDKELVEELPTWSEVTALYGNEPVIYGLDMCEQFRTHSDPADHFVVRLPRTKSTAFLLLLGYLFCSAHTWSVLSFPIKKN